MIKRRTNLNFLVRLGQKADNNSLQTLFPVLCQPLNVPDKITSDSQNMITSKDAANSGNIIYITCTGPQSEKWDPGHS